MKRMGFGVVVVTSALSAGSPSALAGATVALQPARAGGTNTIIGNEMFLPSGGQRVFIEVRLAGWAPQHLKTFQVKIDSSGYHNGTSTIAPAVQLCSGPNSTGDEQCVQAFETGSFCFVTTPSGDICEAGFQNTMRPDWVAFGRSVVPAVDISTLDYRFGGTTISPASITDTGVSRYAGTIVLDVPAGATGTFVIGVIANETFMSDDTVPEAQRIAIDSIIPARITIGEPLVPKNRYIAFTPEEPGQLTAVRVTLNSLYHPAPPFPMMVAGPDFSSFEGQIRWLGPPSDIPERGLPLNTFKGAALQCTPFFADWGSLGLVEVFGDAVLPSSEYTFGQAPIACQNDLGNEQCFSPPVTLRTARWGDITEPFSRIDRPAQPDMGDLAAIVDTFRGLVNSLSKTRTQLQANVADVGTAVNFIDATLDADAFRGVPYPYPGPLSCP